MTGNNNNKFINMPKTYEQFVLEEQQTQSEQDLKIVNSYVAEANADGNLEAQRGYGPCTRSDCSHTFNLKVDITNSSGRGVLWASGSGNTVVYLNSVSEARTFVSQVRGSWVVDGGVWSSSSSSGAGYITEGKRNTIARSVEAQIDSFERGNNIDTTLCYS